MCRHDRKQPDDSITAFPLFPEGNERTPFAYAIFLLNKVRDVLLTSSISPHKQHFLWLCILVLSCQLRWAQCTWPAAGLLLLQSIDLHALAFAGH